MKKINKKGFTLIELLAVVVILLLITLVAIPSIASTFERKKCEINEQKIEVIKSAGGIYASRYKKNNLDEYHRFLSKQCGISIEMLLSKNLITKDELKNSEAGILKYPACDSSGFEVKEENYGSIFIYYNNSSGEYEINNDATAVECGL